MAKKHRVLIVEDEMLVAMSIEDALADAGFEVIGIVSRMDKAKPYIEGDESPDIAVMDLNLAGASSIALADAFVASGIPVVILTGYGTAGLPSHLRQVPVLSKPFDRQKLLRTLETTLGKRTARA
jgi:DNA-binding NtrC family response regulator